MWLRYNTSFTEKQSLHFELLSCCCVRNVSISLIGLQEVWWWLWYSSCNDNGNGKEEENSTDSQDRYEPYGTKTCKILLLEATRFWIEQAKTTIWDLSWTPCLQVSLPYLLWHPLGFHLIALCLFVLQAEKWVANMTTSAEDPIEPEPDR